MKKSTIVSIVLALMLAANAAATATPAIAKKRAAAAALKKDRLFRRNHNNDNKKKRDDSCSAVTCLDEGETCDDDDDTLICKDDLYCVKNKCSNSVEGGDCNDRGYCNGDFYCNNNTCTHMKSEGEPCSGSSECKNSMCNITGDDKIPRVCIPYPEKVSDSCSVYYDNCPTGTTCVYGVCTTYPSTIGADCVEEVGCGSYLYCNSEHKCAEYPKAGEDCLNNYYCADHLYCDDESNKCVKYPGEGEDCYNGYKCDIDLYCNYTNDKCVKLPGLGEECDYRGCASGLVCDYIQDICYNEISGEGGYCSYSVSCGDGLVCNSNKCVPGECEGDDECPSGKGCHNFKCTDFMTLNDGEECSDEESFFCKEGSGCGRNESSSTGYSCMKISTKISDEKVCEDDDDCPSDSYCDCNSANGKTQCLPYFVSNKTVVGYYKKLLTFDDEESDEYEAYILFIAQYVYPVDEEIMCYTVNYTILEGDKGIASNMKPSFALSAVLFVFGLIAAIL